MEEKQDLSEELLGITCISVPEDDNFGTLEMTPRIVRREELCVGLDSCQGSSPSSPQYTYFLSIIKANCIPMSHNQRAKMCGRNLKSSPCCIIAKQPGTVKLVFHKSTIQSVRSYEYMNIHLLNFAFHFLKFSFYISTYTPVLYMQQM